jgi:hypothetical protein
MSIYRKKSEKFFDMSSCSISSRKMDAKDAKKIYEIFDKVFFDYKKYVLLDWL